MVVQEIDIKSGSTWQMALGTAPCDGKRVQWCAHPSATLAHRQLALTARSPAHPLVPYPQPYFTPTYEPLGPDPAAMWKAGGVAGPSTYLLSELDTPNPLLCGSADGQAQGAIISAEVSDAW
eukprot:CAMPEP_0174697538 /NCGR_PEP_ID=MMETSP1094-20130205/3373_1 /TAXON_ID=156173 /ORGANISM="Chrysochromulina brevifilum, Strain UTEX LB 985" /LENGTH=121 /DNA_ID=CAMNT_0015894533 /DNA_START=431 /DNA_END=794 /DNA_ORIENTATION=-